MCHVVLCLGRSLKWGPLVHMWQVHWDDTAAGRQAHTVLLSDVVFRRCLRHQLTAVRRRAGDQKKFIASTIHFSATLMNPLLFHLVWCSCLERLQGEEWGDYVRHYVLRQHSGGLWTAEWYRTPRLASWDPCGDESIRPGFTSASLGQSIESWWSAGKRVIPQNIGHMMVQNATLEVEKYLRASWQVNKGWVKDNTIQPPGDDRWQPWPTRFNAKLLSEGLVERKQDDGGVVRRWPALRTLSSLDLTTTEVKKHGLGKAVARLSKDETVSLMLRQQAQRLVQTWAANLVSR